MGILLGIGFRFLLQGLELCELLRVGICPFEDGQGRLEMGGAIPQAGLKEGIVRLAKLLDLIRRDTP